MPNLVLFTGNANPELARKVASQLHIALGAAHVGTFSDGEIAIEINDNVRGKDVFILQSTCKPTNDNLMEIIVMADALRRASAGRITAVIPYFGYARQDRRVRSARVPITAKIVADMLTTVGVDRVLTVDLHADQIQGFFDIPVDNIYASPVLLADLEKQNYDNLMVVSPDVGGVVRARAVAKQLDDADLAARKFTGSCVRAHSRSSAGESWRALPRSMYRTAVTAGKANVGNAPFHDEQIH